MPKNEADITLRAVAIALANDDFWSPDLLDYPAVKRYLARKAGRDKTESDGELINQYAHHLKVNGRSNWYTTAKGHLLAASEITGSLVNAKTDVLVDFLNMVAEENTIATRNRARASLSGFYRWLRLKQIIPKGHNPLAGIKILKEVHSVDDITIWDPEEVRQLLKAADMFRDGIAIWIPASQVSPLCRCSSCPF